MEDLVEQQQKIIKSLQDQNKTLSRQSLQQPYLENIDSLVSDYDVNTDKDIPSQALVFNNYISRKGQKQLIIQQTQLKD